MGEQPTGSIQFHTAPEDLQHWLTNFRQVLDSYLHSLVPVDTGTPILTEAMRYAVLGPGKRIRPAICAAACTACGGSIQDCLPAAAAVELIHAYSLVHDDLPAMDNDTERRGRATVHVAFDEATAILAGDGLLTLAFATLTKLSKQYGTAVEILSRRAGYQELLAGQARELELLQPNRSHVGLEQLEQIHRGKTGALFAAAAELGAVAAGASSADRRNMEEYGMATGIAFQHADDIDDQDFASLAPLARERIQALCAEATHRALRYGHAGRHLKQIAEWIQQVPNLTPRPL